MILIKTFISSVIVSLVLAIFMMVVLPLAAPVLATSIKDQCRNIEGVQETVPEGYYQKNCNCYEEPKEEEPPVATEPAQPEEPPVATVPATPEVPKQPTLPQTGTFPLGFIVFIATGLVGTGIVIKYLARKG